MTAGMERLIKRQKKTLALIIELRKDALANDRMETVARYDQAIIKAEQLLSIIEHNTEEMADKGKRKK